ncbi:hypothetical protein H101_04936 [Trichophyton interdigitale H6]|nr:hypothetical protein H101_04936 [Trichophyton interdigitale H6]
MAPISLTSITVTDGCTILALLAALYILGKVVYELFINPLASVPGPKLYAVSQFPFLYQSYIGVWPFTLKELHDKYGPVVRISPMDVSLINPDVWKELYTPRSRVGEFKRDNTLRVLDKDGSGIADEDIMEHTRHRRMLSHAFSEKALRGQEGIMQNLVDMLISGLKLHIKKHSSEPVNMTKKYNWATFDVIGDLAFGQPFGCLEADSPHYVISMVNDLFYHMIRTQPFKRFPLLQPFQSLIASPSNAITNVQKFEKFAFETIKKRIENGDAGRKDFISYMQPHNSTGEFTEAELTSNAAALMIAGSETTATTLTAGTYFLLKNPSVYQRLVQEIRSSFKEEKDITISELDNLPYLAAVLTETLRIFPPVPGIMTRVIPKEGKHLCGYWLPGKTVVSVSQLSAYHSERYFLRPEEFIPARWMGDPQFSKDSKDVFQPFSVGPRNCIGQNMARAEMRLIMAKILWNFDLELSPESDNWNEKLIIHGLWRKDPLMVQLKPVLRS